MRKQYKMISWPVVLIVDNRRRSTIELTSFWISLLLGVVHHDAARTNGLCEVGMLDAGSSWHVLALSSFLQQVYFASTKLSNFQKSMLQSNFAGLQNGKLYKFKMAGDKTMTLRHLEETSKHQLTNTETCGMLIKHILF